MTEMQQGANNANIPAITAARTDPPKSRLLSMSYHGALSPGSAALHFFLSASRGMMFITSMAGRTEAHLKPT